MTLPTDIDSTYADDGSDASVKLHQQHHDTIHAAVNSLGTAATHDAVDFDAAGAAAAAQAAAIAAAAADATSKVAAEATARAAAITTAINNLVDGAPGALDTLAEIAAELANDEDALDALTTVVSGKQPLDPDLTAIAALDSSTAGAISSDGAGWVKKSYSQLKTALGLVKGDVGLGNVDNTADTSKPVSTATQAALDLKVTAGAVGTVQVGRMSSDQSFTNNTLGNLTGLSFAIGANEVWKIVVLLIADGGTTGDLQTKVTAPSGATINVRMGGQSVTATSGTGQLQFSDNTNGIGSSGLVGVGTKLIQVMEGVVRASSTAGTVQIQGAQNTTDATATTFYTDSNIVATRLA